MPFSNTQAINQLVCRQPPLAQAELLDFAQFLVAKYHAGPSQPDTRILCVGELLAELGGTQPQLEPVPRRRESPHAPSAPTTVCSDHSIRPIRQPGFRPWRICSVQFGASQVGSP